MCIVYWHLTLGGLRFNIGLLDKLYRHIVLYKQNNMILEHCNMFLKFHPDQS
jgi:hypothetical protein